MDLAPQSLEQPRSDGATSNAAQGPAAFGALYQEHFDGLYDFVARIVRDRDLAGEIVQNTFTKAWDELRAGRELEHPKSWLYAVARNNAIDELRSRARLTGEPVIYAQPDPSRLADPHEVAEANEMVELVWSSAEALTPDEYALLDMHVRHGFGAADLADALDLERGAVYTRLSRLRSSLEESVASTLLIRRGSEDCDELKAIIAEHESGDRITPQLRRAVRAHVKECDVCCAARKRAVSPVALFGALAPIVPLAGMREGIIGAILPGGSHAAAGAGAAGAAGGVAAARHASKVRYLAAAGGVAAVTAAVALALSPSAKVRDPASAASIDHAIGVASADNTVTMHWAPGKNARGYSVVMSRNRSTEPPPRENVKGTRYTSGPLGPGSWWFILRSHGKDGGWTDTLRVGPFVIVAPVAKAPKHVVVHKRAHRAAHRHHLAPRPAKLAARPAPAILVAGVRAAPHPAAPKPQAPRRKPARKPPAVKKPPPPKTPPPSKTPVVPPVAQTPVTPPVVDQPQTPVTPPTPPTTGDDDGDNDQGENDGGDQGGGDQGGQGDGGHHGGDHGHGG